MSAVENHMATGNQNYMLDEPERNKSEVRALFQEWYERQEDDAYYFELFLEDWSMLELLGFSEQNTMQKEFKKWQANYLQKEFKTETDEHISILEIMQEI